MERAEQGVCAFLWDCFFKYTLHIKSLTKILLNTKNPPSFENSFYVFQGPVMQVQSGPQV